ncbi:hypothetical protein GWO43_16015 [candidate division KSB1 bacterium]|nr:hypothetical protein [candidate division KSB1 bacterium]NIV68738.1 hypothetical protein [Phycisphaerae bacterium]NIS25457.1 hypothetical protein [candidate division KSB1 bacterium]NIT72349.1 hypothetical protein [candidate division KSB1 bacterium]NIU26134.1 hypothetical protein [candidate division KSB1 bacterium]
MTHLFAVPKAEMNAVYPLVSKAIDRAIEVAGDRYSEGELERDLKSGHRQLWLAAEGGKYPEIKGVAVTRVYKSGYCQFELCSGYDLDTWFDHIDGIEGWAAEQGYSMEVVGRLGWDRKLKAKGYKPVAMIWRKE